MVSNFGAQLSIRTWKYYKDFRTDSSSTHLGTSPMILYTISTYHTLEIKKLSQTYADRLLEHSNVLAIDLKSDAETPRRLKKKLYYKL